MATTEQQIFAEYQKLSKYQRIIAEIMMYASMVDKTSKIHISRGRTTDLEGKKKIIYQIEVEEE